MKKFTVLLALIFMSALISNAQNLQNQKTSQPNKPYSKGKSSFKDNYKVFINVNSNMSRSKVFVDGKEMPLLGDNLNQKSILIPAYTKAYHFMVKQGNDSIVKYLIINRDSVQINMVH